MADKYGNIVGTSQDDKLVIDIAPVSKGTDTSKYPAIATNTGLFYSTAGVFAIKNV